MYLILHGKLRGQLIQSNDLIGFDNFQRIQNRKWDYLGDAASKRLITELAIREPLVTKPHLKELEVRLSPSMNAENNARNIQTLDRSVTSVERFGEPEKLQELKDRYYYANASLVTYSKAAKFKVIREEIPCFNASFSAESAAKQLGLKEEGGTE